MRRGRGANQVDVLNNTSFLDALFILIGALVFMLLLVALVSEGLKLGYFDLEMPYAEGASLPTGIVGREYDMVVGVYGGNERYSCEMVGGELPSGLEFIAERSSDASVEGTCRIAGVPTEATDGAVQIVLRADDAPVAVPETGEVLDKEPVTRTFSLAVIDPSEASPLSIDMDAVPQAVRNSDYRLFLAAEGGVAPYRWSLVGDLPAGLDMDTDGIVSGTPTGTGTRDVTMVVEDAAGARVQTGPITLDVSREFPADLDIPPLAIETRELPAATAGDQYALYLSASGGVAPYSWRPIGELPEGITCCDGGVMAGTPARAGDYVIRVEVSSTANSVVTGSRAESVLQFEVKPTPPVRRPLQMFPEPR